jgi:hypothetical protein
MSAVLSLAVLASGCGSGPQEDDGREGHLLAGLASEYLSERLAFYPVEATLAGHHRNDGSLGNFAGEEIETRLLRLRDLRQRILGLDLTKLPRAEYIDALLLTNAVKAEIHEIDEVARWKRSPLFYSEIIRSGISSLLSVQVHSEIQLGSLLSRLDQIPQLLEAARSNLDSPPRLWVEEGIADLGRCRRLIQDLPTALGRGSSPRKLTQLGEKSREAARSIRTFILYLEQEVLPQASPSFALGEESLVRQLFYQEMVDTPLDSLRRKGEAFLLEVQAQWEETAARLESATPSVSLLDTLTGDHPAASELVPFAEAVIEDVRRFTVEQELVGAVPETLLQAGEMPYVFGDEVLATQALGRWEDEKVGSVFMLAVPPPDWSPGRTNEHLRLLNTRSLRLSIVRAFGSHLLSLNTRDSEIRKMWISRAHRDGWKSYFQRLFLEEGYEQDDPLLRLMLLRQGLVEQCRLLAAIGLHTEEMSLSEAARLFRDEAYLEPSQAQQEARAVAVAPALMYAALGSRLVSELREDYLDPGDPGRKLRDFHDGFLATGALPMRLARHALLEATPSEF